MRRPVMIIVPALIAIILLALLALGAFPPQPRTQTVQHALPNDRFAPQVAPKSP